MHHTHIQCTHTCRNKLHHHLIQVQMVYKYIHEVLHKQWEELRFRTPLPNVGDHVAGGRSRLLEEDGVPIDEGVVPGLEVVPQTQRDDLVNE